MGVEHPCADLDGTWKQAPARSERASVGISAMRRAVGLSAMNNLHRPRMVVRPSLTRAFSGASASSLRLPASQLPKALAAFHEAFPVHVRKPVEYRDLDVYNHVNNACYFAYFEEARVRGWRAKDDGAASWSVEAKGIAPVLQDTWCNFRVPIGLYDVVHIGLRVEGVQPERASFEHRYCVWSEDHDQVAAQGGATIVLCDFDRGGRRAQGLTPSAMDRWL